MTDQAIGEAIKVLANELRVPVKSVFQYYVKYAIVTGWTDLIVGCIGVLLLFILAIAYIKREDKSYHGSRLCTSVLVFLLSLALIVALALIIGTYIPCIYAPKAVAINMILGHITGH